LRLLVVSESLGRGGAEQALVDLLPALQQLGCSCEVAVLHEPDTLAGELEQAGIPVHRLRLTHRWMVPQGVLRLLRVLRDGPYDIVHGHLFFSGLYVALTYPLLRGVQRIITFHNLGYDTYPANTMWRKVRKGLDAWLMRHWIDRRVAVSRAVATHYETHLQIDAIDVIPNGFPTEHLQPSPALDRPRLLAEFGVGGSEFVALVCGRLVSEKGHRYFIEAIDQLRRRGQHPMALIVGDGPLAGVLTADVRARGLDQQIRFHPAVTRAKLLDLMQAVDLVVMPSTHEGFPLSPGEAMALGRPVLATSVGGTPDLVEDGVSGALVPPADPGALADAIALLMNDPERRQRLGACARQRIAEQFSTGHLAEVWMKYYRRGAPPQVIRDGVPETPR
jgi:glycosyltransferase involved in cell wall biosynthesis